MKIKPMPYRFTIRNITMFLFALGFVTGLMAQVPVGHSEHIVDLFPTQMALATTPQTVNSGSTVVLAATLTRTINSSAAGPTGDVTFTLTPSNGAPALTNTVPVQNGTAMMATVPPIGTDTVVASYQGDLNYSPVLAQTTITVLTATSPDFDFTLPSVTIQAGQSYNGNIMVKTLNGFNGNVTFTVGSLPQDVTFSIPKGSVQVFADAAESGTVSPSISFVLGTQATVVTTVNGLLLLGAVGIRRRKYWRKAYVLLAFLSTSGLALMVGCAGNRFLQSDGTPPGTYSIPVTGTSGNLTHIHNLTLIVKQTSN